jgi:adenylate cyclase class IV
MDATGDTGRRNVQLKAIDPDPLRSLERCLALGAEDHGVLEQRDTYFDSRFGRLKLRESSAGPAELIQYDRPDEPHQRISTYRVVAVPDAARLAQALGAALGVRGVVAKRRHLLTWRGVRIHLDTVDDLGTFIELEAVAPATSDLRAEYELVAHLRRVLDITDDRLCPHGYADQLLAGGIGTSGSASASA